MYSSPTVGAATAPIQPVRNQNLQMVVERARHQLRQLTLQRQEIDQRIGIIKRTINGLALLYGGQVELRSSRHLIRKVVSPPSDGNRACTINALAFERARRDDGGQIGSTDSAKP